METIKDAIVDYKKELTMFLPGAVFLLFILCKLNKYYNLQFVMQLSTVERVFVFILISLVLGRVFYVVGKFFIMILLFLIIEENKIEYIKKEIKSIKNKMSFSIKHTEEETDIIQPEILCYIDKQNFIKKRNEEIHLNVVFWETITGGYIVILCRYLFLVSPLYILLYIFIFIIMILICIYYRKRSSGLWHDCAVAIKRNKQ